jgi:uncharacterized membrane protein
MNTTYIDIHSASQTPGVSPVRRTIHLMRFLSALAVLDLGYLLTASLTDNPLACTPGSLFDCSAAFATRYAYVGPLPTSAVGLAVYASIFGLLLWLNPSRSPTRNMAAWRLLTLLVSLAAGAAIWLMTVQLSGFSAMCPYCMFTHSIGLILAFLVFKSTPLPAAKSLKTALVAALGVLLLVTLQIGFPHSVPTNIVRVTGGAPGVPVTSLDDPELSDGNDFDTGPGPNRQIGILGGQIRLSPKQLPMVGAPDAAVVMVVLYDYACPNCRKLHRYTESARKRYPGQFATVLLPVPLDKACNPYVAATEKGHEDGCALAKIAMAVWIAKPSEFASFNSWMLDRDETVSLKAAREEAGRRIGAETLEATLRGDRVDRELKKGLKVYAAANKGSVPRVLTPAKNEKGQPYTLQIVGRPDNENELFRLFESDLHMKPAEATVQRDDE